MNLLAISYCSPPMAYPQATQIGRLLSHSKLRICAISGGDAAEPDFSSRVDHRIVPFDDRRKFWQKIAVRALPLYGSVPDLYRDWVEAAYKQIEALIAKSGKPDLIATFGEPMSDHLLGLRLKKVFNVPWLAHFSDPWSDNPFRKLQPVSKFVNRALERRVIEDADAVVFTSPETIDLVFRKYSPALRQKAFLLSHAYDPKLYGNYVKRSSGPIMLRYIGNFYGHRSPKPLIEALAELQRNESDALLDVRVELIGSIAPRMMRSSEWRSLPPELLVARGSVSYAESLRLMRDSDILLTIDAPADLSVFFPSKLADYIGAGRHLVGIVPPGAAARIIGECGGRSISPSGSVENLAIFLRDEIAAARSRRDTVEAIAPRNDRYNIGNVAAIFDSLCQKTVELAQARREF